MMTYCISAIFSFLCGLYIFMNPKTPTLGVIGLVVACSLLSSICILQLKSIKENKK